MTIRRTAVLGAALAALALASIRPAPAAAPAARPLSADQTVWLRQKVSIADTSQDFGTLVALSDGMALVSAPTAEIDGVQYAGAVYVYQHTGQGWIPAQEITAPDGISSEQFGYSLAHDGDTVVIGTNQQKLYVYTGLAPNVTPAPQIIHASDVGVSFFDNVSVEGSALFVSSGDGPVSGQHYWVLTIFERDNSGVWSFSQNIPLITLGAGQTYLMNSIDPAVAPDGLEGFAGLPFATVGGNQAEGEVDVFAKSNGTWSQTQTLTASDGTTGWTFGRSSVFDGTTAIVAATNEGVPQFGPTRSPAANSGRPASAAYVFTESNGSWSQTQELTADYPGTTSPVYIEGEDALDGSTALIGGQDFGYVFDKSGGSWYQAYALARHPDSRGVLNSSLDQLYALSGSTALIGGASTDDYQDGTYNAVNFYDRNRLSLAFETPSSRLVPGQTYDTQVILTNDAATVSAPVAVTVTANAAASLVSATASQGSCMPNGNGVRCAFGPIAGNAGTATADVEFKTTGSGGEQVDHSAFVGNSTPELVQNAGLTIDTPPVADDGSLTVEENTGTDGTLKATDPDTGDILTYSVKDQAAHGSASIYDARSGAYVYVPNNGYTGADSFTFKANDGYTDSNVATVSVTVKASSGGGTGGGSGSSGGGGGGLGGPTLAALAGLALAGRSRRRSGRKAARVR